MRAKMIAIAMILTAFLTLAPDADGSERMPQATHYTFIGEELRARITIADVEGDPDPDQCAKAHETSSTIKIPIVEMYWFEGKRAVATFENILASDNFMMSQELRYTPQRTGHYYYRYRCTMADGGFSDWKDSTTQIERNDALPPVEKWWWFVWIAAPSDGGFE